jgi:hypothetical protein
MVAPTESHSISFSGLSAGNEDDPGSVIPRASAALAMVFAVYIFRQCKPASLCIIRYSIPLHTRRAPGTHDARCYTVPSPHRVFDRLANIYHMIGRRRQCLIGGPLRKNRDEWCHHIS